MDRSCSEIRGGHDTGLSPYRRMRSAEALTLVVERDPFLLRAVDLDVGRVEIDRRAHRDKAGPTLLSQARQSRGEQAPWCPPRSLQRLGRRSAS